MSAQVFAAMMNTDRTEGRGWEYPASLHPDVDGAAQVARTSGVMGTASNVTAYLLGSASRTDIRTVVGTHVDPTGDRRWGPIPEERVTWPKEKVARYRALRAQFPDRPDPLRYEPGPAAPLPAEDLFAIVKTEDRYTWDHRWDADFILGFASEAAYAVAAATSVIDAARERPKIRVVKVAYGTLPWKSNVLHGETVWAPEPEPAKAAALAELEEFEAELRSAR